MTTVSVRNFKVVNKFLFCLVSWYNLYDYFSKFSKLFYMYTAKTVCFETMELLLDMRGRLLVCIV